MDSNEIFWIVLASLVVLAIWAWVLYEIISSASRGKKVFNELELQTSLLMEIAKKLGVEEKLVNDIVYEEEVKD